MAFGPTLYGQRPYAYGDYSESQYTVFLADSVSGSDAFALSLQSALADAVSGADVFGAALAGVLSDALSTAADALAKAALIDLSDAPWALPPGRTITPSGYGACRYGRAMYSTDTFIPAILDILSTTLAAALMETLSTSDAMPADLQLILKESMGLSDAFDVMADRVELSDFLLLKEFISVRLKRSSGVWAEGGTKRRGIVPHIYGRVLYAKNMYSTNIAILWDAIQKSRRPGFTNEDGHRN